MAWEPICLKHVGFPEKHLNQNVWWHEKVLLESFPMNDHVRFSNIFGNFCIQPLERVLVY
jgi:hypothetical protein